MLPPVNTKDPVESAAFVRKIYTGLFPGHSTAKLDKIFTDVVRVFEGRHPEFSKVDLGYHDLEHTLQVTICLSLVLEGRVIANAEPKLTVHQFELAIASALLHDIGYIKYRSDTEGTGAKYTYCHVLRSCAYAAIYVPTLGATPDELEDVLGAINCTGPTKEISRLRFRENVFRVIGCSLATSDYLSQLAEPKYPDRLEVLYNEFLESDNYINMPHARRMFKSADELIQRTPGFWEKFVKPKLDADFQGMYRYLARPYPNGPNPYIEAVEYNFAVIKRRIAEAKPVVA